MNPNKIATATINKIINGGYGLCTAENGKTMMVRHGLPGETVEIEIIERQQRVDYGAVRTVLAPHQNRIEPPCPYYATCGGCNLQHADYSTQCTIKDQILQDLLKRNQASGLHRLRPLLSPIIPSPEQFGYRQRIRLKTGQRQRLGFSKFRSHEIIAVKRCLLAPEHINAALEYLQESSRFHSLFPHLEEIDILSNPGDNSLCLVLYLTRKPRPTDRKVANTLAMEMSPGTRIFLAGRQFSMEGPFSTHHHPHERCLQMSQPGKVPITLFWEAGGFCQVNINQNANLVDCVLDFSDPSTSDTVLDLYCGMGNFALPLALHAKHVHGIEGQGAAIRCGELNSEYNGLTNITFEKSDVMRGGQILADSQHVFDIVVCDPPRQGMVNMAPLLKTLCRRKLVYISCDPATLCRDLAMMQKEGFSVKKIQPFDMFPQTHHIETVTLLEKVS